MAIIRNDRRAREAQAEAERAAGNDEADEMVTDYSWHPTLEEFDPHLSVDDWLALLDDPSVFDKDGLHAVECLRQANGPTTLQQLSVQFRGTMGRYRRWLNTTAERVGRHLGIPAPQQDQFGNDEWWPLLYQRRGIGKAVANQHELLLREELAQALDQRSAQKKRDQHRAEQAQLQERERQVRQRAQALRGGQAGAGSVQRDATGAPHDASAEGVGEGQRAFPSVAEQRRAAQQARAEREARMAQITVDRDTESVPDVYEPEHEEEPQPRMTKAQAAVAARIAEAQRRAGQTHAPAAARPSTRDKVTHRAQPAAAEASGNQDGAGSADRPHEPEAARPADSVQAEAAPEPRAKATSDATTVVAAGDVPVGAGAAQSAAGGSAKATSAGGSQASAVREAAQAVADASGLPLGSLQAYLAALEQQGKSQGSTASSGRAAARRSVSHGADSKAQEPPVHMPLDYAVRYSDRLWAALDLVADAVPDLTAARVARLAGCDSVEEVQRILNGEGVPSFAFVDELCQTLGLNHAFLETTDEVATHVPVFATVQELVRAAPLGTVLGPSPVTCMYVVKAGDARRSSTMALRFGDLRCLLVDRTGVALKSDDEDPAREAFLALVHDLQEYALKEGVGFNNVDLSAKEWRTLASGRAWPGSLL